MSGEDEGAPDPEAVVKHDLTEWLEENGCEVYWDMNNRWDHPTFQTIGSTERPDLMIPEVPIGYKDNKRTLALEVKVEGGSRIFTAIHQTVRYWKRAVTGDSVFEIDGETIEPTIFAAANDESPSGRLIDPDTYEQNGEAASMLGTEAGSLKRSTMLRLPCSIPLCDG